LSLEDLLSCRYRCHGQKRASRVFSNGRRMRRFAQSNKSALREPANTLTGHYSFPPETGMLCPLSLPDLYPGSQNEEVTMAQKQPVNAGLTPEQQFLNDLWEEHLRDEFTTQDTDQTLETMVPDAYVNHIPVLTGGVGREQLRKSRWQALERTYLLGSGFGSRAARATRSFPSAGRRHRVRKKTNRTEFALEPSDRTSQAESQLASDGYRRKTARPSLRQEKPAASPTRTRKGQALEEKCLRTAPRQSGSTVSGHSQVSAAVPCR